MGLKLQSNVVTLENVTLLYFISFFPWGFSPTKSGRRMCHQAIMIFYQHLCLTIPGDQIFPPVSYKVL